MKKFQNSIDQRKEYKKVVLKNEKLVMSPKNDNVIQDANKDILNNKSKVSSIVN